jgi:ABC-type transporter Mla MlaB component
VADEVLRIIKAHDQPGLIIAGEIDEAGYPLLLQSLAVLDPQGEAHVDLGGVEFCDLAGLRAIVCVGRPDEDASPGRHVCLHAVPPQLLKVLRILGWDETPGLVLEASSLDGLAAPADVSAGRPDRYPGGPDPHSGGPDPYSGGPDPYSGGPDPYSGGPDPYSGGPDPYSGEADPAPPGEQPARHAEQPAC